NDSPHIWAQLGPADREALEEALAAYALGALGEGETSAVERHLGICVACRIQAAALQATVGLLPAATDDVEPAPAARTRLLAAVPADRTYQVWLIRDGRPESARIFPAGSAGDLAGALAGDLAGASTVAVSVEPAGGSPAPTGPIVLATSL